VEGLPIKWEDYRLNIPLSFVSLQLIVFRVCNPSELTREITCLHKISSFQTGRVNVSLSDQYFFTILIKIFPD